MRLGFDLDEVVVDLAKEVEKYVSFNYGLDWSSDCIQSYGFKKEKFCDDDDLNHKISEEIRPLLDTVDFQFPADPISGAAEALKKLSRSGHKLFFISSRPKENREATVRWLLRYSIPFEEVVTIGHHAEKGFYGRKFDLDMYTDDLQKHLESMYKYKTLWKKSPGLFSRPWNKGPIDATKFKRLDSWEEIIRYIGIQNR